ncbi:MAG: hypothetical protein AB7Q04_13955 [Steroidobacteraceae bacterium]
METSKSSGDEIGAAAQAEASATAATRAREQADSAAVAALDAQNRADTAASSAGIAQSKAAAAAAAALVSQEAANPAASSAVEASGKAEAAATAATTHQTRAEAAGNAAVAAQAQAEPAAVAAHASQAKADAAATAALTAQGKAEEAASASTVAKGQAEPAAVAALAAQANAEVAATAIATALSGAEKASSATLAAQKLAEPAASAALAAQGKADKASEEAEAQLQTLRRTLENSITASLGGAFQKKADNAKKLDLIWLGVLAAGIGLILYIGFLRYPAMLELIKDKAAIEYMLFQIVLNGIALAGPIWLSWVATKRLSNIFAISEDYAYKAAIAQAYQGYRDSMKDADLLMQHRLFATVVTQLDANPARFVSERHPGSPLQDLLQQPWMEEALRNEGFREQFVAWFKYKYSRVFEVPKS